MNNKHTPSELVFYQDDAGTTQLHARLADETVWLTHEQIGLTSFTGERPTTSNVRLEAIGAPILHTAGSMTKLAADAKAKDELAQYQELTAAELTHLERAYLASLKQTQTKAEGK